MRRIVVTVTGLLLAYSVIFAPGCTARPSEPAAAPVKPAAPEPAPELSPEENLLVARFHVDLTSTVLDGSRYEQLLDSTDEVIALARQKPDAIYATDDEERTMRQVLADAAADLNRYQPDLAKQLELAIETLPPAK